MAVSEKCRRLYRRLEQLLGIREATVLMEQDDGVAGSGNGSHATPV